MTNPERERPHDATERARAESARDSSSSTNEERNPPESNLDKTIAGSFPASDPPSPDPDPDGAS